MCLFSFGKLFCDLFLLLFLLFFRSSKREERQAKGRCMVGNMELCCSQRTKNHHKFKCFQVKLFFFSLCGLEAQAKPHNTQVQSM